MRTRTASPASGGKKSSTPKSGRGRGRPPKQSPSSAAPLPPKQDLQAMAPADETPQEAKVEAAAAAAVTPPAAEEKKAGAKGKSPVAAAAVVAADTDKEAQAEAVENKVGEKGKSTEAEAKPDRVVQVTKEGQEEVELKEQEMEVEVKVKEQEVGVKVEEGKVEDVAGKDIVVAESAKEEENEEKESFLVNDGGMDAVEEEEKPEEVFEETVEGERMAVEGGGGEEGVAVDEGQGEEDGGRVEEDEQMVISDMARKRKLKKELEIFLGGLDRDAVEEDIKKAFEQVGEVVEVRLHKDFATNKNKGFAFVKFANKEQVARALAEMKNPMICGKRCGIAASEDNDTLFLGNICNTWTKEAVKRKLQDYGIEGVENLTLVPDTQNEGLSRGFAFLEFSCHAEAMLAFKRLQKPDVVFGHPERTAKVAFAEPLREPDPEVMAQVKSVFIDGLPPYWDEDRVKVQFKGYGEIERVVLARNMSTAKRNDFGFVNFTTHEAALACIEGTNNTELGDDGKSKVKVRARLANPLPKTQAVKGGMSGGFRIGYSGAGFNRFGRGFGRGRFFPHRAGFQGGRGFNSQARGRGGRFNFAGNNSFEAAPSDFRGRRPFGFRGGRWQSGSGRHGSFDRGRGRGFPPSRRPPFEPDRDFGGPFGEDPYFYGDVGHGVKRPFSMMEHDPGYFEHGPRVHPRFDHPDPLSGGSRYRESFGMGNLYSRDYFGPGPDQYGSSTYSSLYRGEHSGGGYYY